MKLTASNRTKRKPTTKQLQPLELFQNGCNKAAGQPACSVTKPGKTTKNNKKNRRKTEKQQKKNSSTTDEGAASKLKPPLTERGLSAL